MTADFLPDLPVAVVVGPYVRSLLSFAEALARMMWLNPDLVLWYVQDSKYPDSRWPQTGDLQPGAMRRSCG